jgi:recombination protein RecR
MTVDPIERLILELGRLPGVGERSATRLAFHIIRQSRRRGDESLARDLAAALVAVADEVGLCDTCRNLSTGSSCRICKDPRRDPAVICVVEGVQDLRAIEATQSFSGRYHVLHGALAPLDGIGPDDLKLGELAARLGDGVVREVILATNSDVEGDATALYIAGLVRPLGAKVTRLASGIPLGGELEFLDQATLGRAMAERRDY